MKTESLFTTTVGGHEMRIATGKLAEQAGGAITLQVGDSMLLATATMSRNIREGLDFFPLSVDFEEKMYAAGRIPGGFFRREGKPTTEAVLTSRLTDRPLRPLFPDGMRNEVQVIVTTLSSDSIHHLDIMSVNAASAALTISDVPWNGPIGAVRVGYIDGQFVIDPTIPQMAESKLDLRMAGTRDAIIMVEAAANEVPEDVMVEALEFGHKGLQPIIDLLQEMRAAIGKEKREPTISEIDSVIADSTKSRIAGRIADVIASTTEREDRNEA
ncbi:MAG TPA: polyribonucleotide nucleotidyltransferase, partial [Promineifilum sp.]